MRSPSKKRLTVAVAAGLLLAVACGEGPTVPPDDPDSPLFKPDKDPPVKDIPLEVNFAGGLQVSNDIGSPYVHRVDGVQTELQARLDRLWFETSGGGKPPAIPRTVCFDFSGEFVPHSGASDPFEDPEFCADVLWHTRNNLFDGTIAGMEPQPVEPAYTGGKFLWSDGDTQYFLVYDCGNGFDPLTSCDDEHVKGEGFLITRVDGDTWTIEPGPDTFAELWVWPSGSEKTLVGTYDMPFFATLTRK